MIQLTDPLQDPQWDTRLPNGPGRSFFHGAAWARVLRATYGFSPKYFLTRDEHAIRELLPTMEVDSWLTGRRGVSLPFTDACEAVCPNAETFHRLFLHVLDYARTRQWRYLELRGGRKWASEAPPSTSFFGHTLRLNQIESDLFGQLDGAVRRAIRKAEGAGLSIEFADSMSAVHEFYRLLCKTRKRHGLPPQPFRFFANIQREILGPKQGVVVLARIATLPVAGAIFFHGNATAVYKFGASDAAYQHLRPNNLVMWEAIKHHARLGFLTMDFGRTSLFNAGLRQFKLSWGSQEHVIDYLKYCLKEDRFVTSSDQAAGWHNRVFQRLPTFLSRLLGVVLYRHMA